MACHIKVEKNHIVEEQRKIVEQTLTPQEQEVFNGAIMLVADYVNEHMKACADIVDKNTKRINPLDFQYFDGRIVSYHDVVETLDGLLCTFNTTTKKERD